MNRTRSVRTMAKITRETNARRFAAWSMRANGSSYKEIGAALGISESRARELARCGAYRLAKRAVLLSKKSVNDPPWLKRLRAAGALPDYSAGLWAGILVNELLARKTSAKGT